MEPLAGDDVLIRRTLVALLNKIEVPTLIVREDGVVGLANIQGYAWWEDDTTERNEELRAAMAGGRTQSRLNCTRLDGRGWFIVSAPGPEKALVERAGAKLRLTRRQRDVLELVVAGKRNRTIAELLGISARTVEVHLSRIYMRAGVENRASLVSLVLRAA